MTQQLRLAILFDGQSAELNKSYPLHEESDSIKISSLKFYLTNIEILDKDGQVVETCPDALISLEDSSHFYLCQFRDWKASNRLRFTLGVDSLKNMQGAIEGPLDPINGMYWSWQSGYINFKFEASSPIIPTKKNKLQLHLGGYQYPFRSDRAIEVSLSHKMTVFFELRDFIDAIDLKTDHTEMSPSKESVILLNKAQKSFKSL